MEVEVAVLAEVPEVSMLVALLALAAADSLLSPSALSAWPAVFFNASSSEATLTDASTERESKRDG